MSKKVWCLFGVHDLEIIERIEVDHYFGKSFMYTASHYHMRCKLCGKLKTKVLK